MTVIITALGWDQVEGDNRPVLCTPAMAASHGWEVQDGSEREVPDAHVDGNGIYRPPSA